MDNTTIIVVIVVSPFSMLCRHVVDRQMVLRVSENAVLSICPRIVFVLSLTSQRRQTALAARKNTNDTDKASKLCEMIRVGAHVAHHDEAQHDHDDNVCYVGDCREIPTDAQTETNTQRDVRIAQR